MIQRLDQDWWRGKHNDYRDDGPVVAGAKTRRFSIFNRRDRSLLGYVKWFNTSRCYSLFPLNSVFHPDVLIEIVTFCQEATQAHKDRRPLPKPKKLIYRPSVFERTISRRPQSEQDYNSLSVHKRTGGGEPLNCGVPLSIGIQETKTW